MEVKKFEQFTDKFADVCKEYAEYVEKQLKSRAETTATPTPQMREQLVEEVRALNVLAVTVGRLEALRTEKSFGEKAGL